MEDTHNVPRHCAKSSCTKFMSRLIRLTLFHSSLSLLHSSFTKESTHSTHITYATTERHKVTHLNPSHCEQRLIDLCRVRVFDDRDWTTVYHHHLFATPGWAWRESREAERESWLRSMNAWNAKWRDDGRFIRKKYSERDWNVLSTRTQNLCYWVKMSQFSVEETRAPYTHKTKSHR